MYDSNGMTRKCLSHMSSRKSDSWLQNLRVKPRPSPVMLVFQNFDGVEGTEASAGYLDRNSATNCTYTVRASRKALTPEARESHHAPTFIVMSPFN